ncbi:YaaA family protein [Candidatus Saccharibacteria bacterium]|nr:YaaA family protein [Candidatus Saccharibacteria bacterium]
MTILLHSSKTMRPLEPVDSNYHRPALLTEAAELALLLRTLSPANLQEYMQLSAPRAEQTHALIQAWTTNTTLQRPAIDAFLGDIYSGLQVQSLSSADRAYANDHLLILSGLYGGLRALDSIQPYRLEMGYKLPTKNFKNLYEFWGTKIAGLVPTDTVVINLSAVEYTKAVLPYIQNTVITPKFLTVSPKTGEPTFVTVHAKVARGAFARWLIKRRVSSANELTQFNDLNYSYNATLSTDSEPVFVCSKFGGIGLSVRLSRTTPLAINNIVIYTRQYYTSKSI